MNNIIFNLYNKITQYYKNDNSLTRNIDLFIRLSDHYIYLDRSHNGIIGYYIRLEFLNNSSQWRVNRFNVLLNQFEVVPLNSNGGLSLNEDEVYEFCKGLLSDMI